MIYWHSVQDFIAMGGYALYVWGSVLVVAAFLLAEIVLVRLRRRSVLDQIAHSGRARQRRSV